MKRTKSSTKSEMGFPIQRLSPIVASISQETLNYMKDCEAREWLRRRKEKAGAEGVEKMTLWWEKTKNDIKRIRGDKGIADLIRRMEAQRNNVKAAIPSKRTNAKQQERQALGGNAQSQETIQRGLFLSDET
jgi:hypothetical protein